MIWSLLWLYRFLWHFNSVSCCWHMITPFAISVNTYLDLVGGYNTDGVELSFQQSSISTHMLACHASPYEYMQRREEFFQQSYRLEGQGLSDSVSTCSTCSVARGHHSHPERFEASPGVAGRSYDKGYETMSQGSHDSDELPPAIPPKKKDANVSLMRIIKIIFREKESCSDTLSQWHCVHLGWTTNTFVM